MATQYTSLLGFALPVTGELSGTWGDVVNDSITELVEDAIAGSSTKDITGADWTLTTTGSGSTNEARSAILIATGTPGTARNIVAPSQSKAYIVSNQSDSTVTIKGSATTGVAVAAGTEALVAWDGSDFVNVSVKPAGSNTQVQYNNNGVLGASSALTFDGTTLATTTVDATNLEVTNLKAKDGTAAGSIANSTGVVTLASSVLTTTDINGGTVDNVTIGGATPGLITGTTITANTAVATDTINEKTTAAGVTIDSVLLKDDVVNATDVEVGSISANDGTQAATIANSTGVMTIASSVLTTTDINGGTIDGATIGGSSAAAGTFTNLTATGTSSLNGAVVINESGADVDFRIESDTNANMLFVDAGNSRVGIGTSSPAQALDVDGNIIADNFQLKGSDTADNLACTYGYQSGSNGSRLVTWGNGTSRSGAITFDTGGSESMRIDSSGNVGIGTSSPSSDSKLHILAAGTAQIRMDSTGTASGDGSFIRYMKGGTDIAYIGIAGPILGSTSNDTLLYSNGVNNMLFSTNGAERMRIDSSGNLLVGTTSYDSSIDGFGASGSGGPMYATATAQRVQILNRRSSDGEILNFRKDGTTVGSIGSFDDNHIFIGAGDTGLTFNFSVDGILPHNPSNNTQRDNAIDLGYSTVRFDDIYATNGTIQTSDRNEKQDIEELSEAEQRVAIAAKGLLRKFRWKSAVAEKGDDARIHFGIIAQDLQDAFAAEGLDAGRYAMFISSTWWETQTEVPAVEAVEAQDAVYDDEGNLVSEAVEAVEAKEAYTRTDTYETAEEAPEGATERTRLGVRYPELLAFIIAAI